MIFWAFLSTAATVGSMPNCNPDESELTGGEGDYFVVEEVVELCHAALANTVEKARNKALMERDFVRESTNDLPPSTLDLDEVKAFDEAQSLWEKSMEADCLMLTAGSRHVNPPILAHVDVYLCEATRMKQRIELLTERYSLTKDEH